MNGKRRVSYLRVALNDPKKFEKYWQQDREITTFELLQQMSENNRNCEKFPLLLGEKKLNILDFNNSKIDRQVEQKYSNTKREETQPHQTIQMPVTHLKIQDQPSGHQLTEFSRSDSSDQLRQSSTSHQQQQQKYLKISDLFNEYEEIIKNIDSKQASTRNRIITNLTNLCSKCMELEVEPPAPPKAKNLKQEESPLAWMMLMISGTLNLWKLLSESTQIDKPLPILDVVKRSCKKLVAFLQISEGKRSSFSLIPDKAKNKLILLLIIWAKQELSTGDKQEALKICNLCSSLITNSSDSNYGVQANSKAISRQNKFKLHYLRMKIFHQMGQTKEEIQQIIICESLLKTLNDVSTKHKSSKRPPNFENQIFQPHPTLHKTQNNLNILSKLEKRKQQILIGKKSIQKLSSHSEGKQDKFKIDERTLVKCNSKFKQIRDSFQITCREQENFKLLKPTNRIRSVSNKKFSKQKSQNAYQLRMNSTIKQEHQILSNSKIAFNQNQETKGKFKHILKIDKQNKKSLSLCKLGMESGIQNKKKIQQKYELTSKKLAKRPMLSINKNKEFDYVLKDLENETHGQKEIYGKNTQIGQNFTSLNYYQLLAKRPQNRNITLGLNKKSSDNSIQVPQQQNNQKNLAHSEKDESNTNDKKQLAAVSAKVLRECIERINRQTIDKYFQKVVVLKKKKNTSYKQYDNCSQEKIDNDESSSDTSESDISSEMVFDLKSKDKNKQGAMKEAQNKLITKDLLQDEVERTLQLDIRRTLFPGLGMCNLIKITVKKVRQAPLKTGFQDQKKSILLLSGQFYCDSGVHWLIHKMPEDFFQPGLGIAKSIIEKVDVDLVSLRRKNQTSQNKYSEQQRLSKAMLKYLKQNIEMVNKGLGVRLKQKIKRQIINKSQPIELDVEKCYTLNRIYLQKKKSFDSLFSDQNLYNISLKQVSQSSLKPASAQYWGKLKILFVAIQKTKKSKQMKLTHTNGPKKAAQKVNIMSEAQNFPTNSDFMKEQIENDSKKNRKLNKRKSILKLNAFQPIEVDENNGQKESCLENLLVPVVKYIVLGQTAKPKHKLKTILTKTKLNVWDSSIFENEEEYIETEQRCIKNSSRANCKYGLLAPYLDDEQTMKLRNISTSIYSHIIGKFFMEGTSKNIIGYSIPDEFMLSLKYYLMIPDHINRTNNIIDRFYEKFQYSFFHKLNWGDSSVSNKKTCIVNVTLFRVKKLYRIGLQKFYLLKFSVQEKKARSQINKLIVTSFDIEKHFHGSEFNLIQLLQKAEDCKNFEPIQNVPYTKFAGSEIKQEQQVQQITNVRIKSVGQKISNLDQDDTNQAKSFFGNYLRHSPLKRVQTEINSARSQIISDSRTQSEGQVHSQIQLEHKAPKKRKVCNILQDCKTDSKDKEIVESIGSNNNNLYVNWNRLSCPEKRFLNQLDLKQKTSRNMFSVYANGNHSKNHRHKHETLENGISKPRQDQLTSFNYIQCSEKTLNKANTSSFKQGQIQLSVESKKQIEDNIALCLKKISQRITIYKTFLHSKIGIQPMSPSGMEFTGEEGDSRQKVACYANKFRFSRNKHLNETSQFLSPHINCLKILFQKTTKIKCDGVFAVLTVLKIKHCEQFYIKIYLPSCQKTMSFTISCRVFEYFPVESLTEIFSPFIQFKSLESQPQQKDMKQGMVGKIAQYFASQASEQDGDNRNEKMKVIWSQIFRHLEFERRYLGTDYQQEDQANEGHNSQLFLIAKLGSYEAFVKNFSVDQYIVVDNYKNKEPVETSSILQVEVSLGQKLDGLNFIQKNKHSQAIQLDRKLRKRNQKKGSRPKAENYGKMQSSFRQLKHIYESEANKHIIYICITNSKTNEKICYNYYLCEILHLLDHTSLGVIRDNNEPANGQGNRGGSAQFKEIILNYAILFKVLNYIKNQFIIELQTSGRSYLPRLYRDPKLKQDLKNNVDKILIYQQDGSSKLKRCSLQKKQSINIENSDENIFSKLLNNLLSNTIELNERAPTGQSQLQQGQKKEEVKITFNSQIKRQRIPKLLFLVRKVVARQGYPISCIFLNKIQNMLKIYLTSSKNGRTREIQIPISSHPLPYIDILIKQSQTNRKRKNCQEDDNQNEEACEGSYNKREGGLMLSLRNRLRKYHHNMTLLASI